MKYRLAEDAHLLKGQPMFQVLTRVKELEKQGKNIVHFEIGDPDFNTPENIVDAVCQSVRAGDTHYESSLGNKEFREAICDVTFHSRGFKPSINQVLVTPGANIIIYYAVRCLVNPGDEVIVPDPGFPTYYSVMDFCRVKPVHVPLYEKNAFQMNPDDIEARITEKTRMIVVNSPHNPTGSVMTKEELDRVAEIAEKYDIFLYCDEIYSRMIYEDGYKFYSPSSKDQCKTRTIVANGFSKAFAMTGWRLGAVIAPEDVIEKMGLLLETTSSCVTPFIQQAGMEAINDSQDSVWKMMAEYQARRDLIVNGLNDVKGISCLKPKGAFYIFPNISRTGMNSEEFARFCLEEAGVALLPGTNFGPSGQDYVRLCCANSRENIVEGIARIKKAVESKK